MNALELFISKRPFGFVTENDLAELVRLHRLCLVLVRCHGGRFLAPAQDVQHFIACAIAGGDSIRDVSIASEEIQNARKWKPEQLAFADFGKPVITPAALPVLERAPTSDPMHPTPRRDWDRELFNEAECGGVFDGLNTVVSDADSGL